MGFVEAIIDPLRYPFMVRGLIAAMSVGGLCAVVGSFVVLRGMAFMGDAIAHSILPGLAGSILTAGRGDRRALFWWALVTAETLERVYRVRFLSAFIHNPRSRRSSG